LGEVVPVADRVGVAAVRAGAEDDAYRRPRFAASPMD
jgi:hypothetical protein